MSPIPSLGIPRGEHTVGIGLPPVPDLVYPSSRCLKQPRLWSSSASMSFLHRRSLLPALPPASLEGPAVPVPFPPAVENIYISRPSTRSSAGSNGKVSGPTRLIRHVSTLFSTRKKRRQGASIAPIAIDARANSKWRITSDSLSIAESDASEDDIRRPSGLGRAASISSNRSLPPSPFTAIDEESPFHVALDRGFERTRAMSTPNLLRSMDPKTRAKLSRRSSIIASHIQDTPPSFILQVPREVLISILILLPRHSAAFLAATSRDFCAAVRFVLYDKLDLRTMKSTQVEGLITLLAYRQDLADLVQTFECHTWPAFFPTIIKLNGVHPPSFSPSLTATFTIAFQNMHHITSLILPSFDSTFLRHHSAFGLKTITFLSPTMATAETTQLFTWLNGQINITHLAFPNLVEQNDTPATHIDTPKGSRYPNNTLTDSLNTQKLVALTSNITPSSSPLSFSFPMVPTTPKTPFNSPALLPALATIIATPSIITSLFSSGPIPSSRPLRHVTLNINKTLYTGLRPAALMAPLQGISHLALKFGPAVDRRTVGKVLSAAAVLSGDGEMKDTKDQVLQVLEVELADYTDGADQALYKVINTVLPRYYGLLTLRIRPSGCPSSEGTQSGLMAPIQSERDDMYIQLWSKHCSTLQSVQLLSGTTWQRS